MRSASAGADAGGGLGPDRDLGCHGEGKSTRGQDLRVDYASSARWGVHARARSGISGVGLSDAISRRQSQTREADLGEFGRDSATKLELQGGLNSQGEWERIGRSR